MTTDSDTAHADRAALTYFATELGDRWPDVAPFCVDPGCAGDTLLRATRLRADDSALPGSALGDLDALFAGWPHYSQSQRAVLQGAVTYVTGTDDPAHAGGEVVVEAAVRAVLRGGRH